jgi:hypothetical protein
VKEERKRDRQRSRTQRRRLDTANARAAASHECATGSTLTLASLAAGVRTVVLCRAVVATLACEEKQQEVRVRLHQVVRGVVGEEAVIQADHEADEDVGVKEAIRRTRARGAGTLGLELGLLLSIGRVSLAQVVCSHPHRYARDVTEEKRCLVAGP